LGSLSKLQVVFYHGFNIPQTSCVVNGFLKPCLKFSFLDYFTITSSRGYIRVDSNSTFEKMKGALT